jgi:hypothetical protein
MPGGIDRPIASGEGTDFRAVAVMACDYEALSSEERVEAVADEVDPPDFYTTERRLLDNACTTARVAYGCLG